MASARIALVCADLVGTTAATLDVAVTHARTREQFGRPVGSFQAVQQLCADQLVSVESCRSITWQASWAVDELDPIEALSTSRIAKAYCSEVGRAVCEAAIQVWGVGVPGSPLPAPSTAGSPVVR